MIGERIWKKKPTLLTPDLRLPASRLGENKSLLFKPPHPWYFLVAAIANHCIYHDLPPSCGEGIIGGQGCMGRAGLRIEDPMGEGRRVYLPP